MQKQKQRAGRRYRGYEHVIATLWVVEQLCLLSTGLRRLQAKRTTHEVGEGEGEVETSGESDRVADTSEP